MGTEIEKRKEKEKLAKSQFLRTRTHPPLTARTKRGDRDDRDDRIEKESGFSILGSARIARFPMDRLEVLILEMRLVIR